MPRNEQANFERQNLTETDFSSVLFATLVKLVILAVFVGIIYRVVPERSIDAEKHLPAFVFPQKDAIPENQEKAAYVGVLFLFLPLSYLLNKRIRLISAKLKMGSWVLALLLILFIWNREHFFYFHGIPSPFVLLFVGIILFGLQRMGRLNIATLQKYNLSHKTYWALAAVYIFIHFWIRLIPENDAYIMHSHFEAMLFANWQVLSGKTLTVDLFHQYGLYPEFLGIVWRLSGKFSILGFTATLSLLAAVYHYCLFYFAARHFKQKLLGFFVVAGIIQFSSFFTSALFDKTVYDPYFQYVGVRTFFPGLLLFFLTKLPECPTFRRTVFYTVILSFAPFWNLDTGLVCVGSWFIYLLTQNKSYVRPILISSLSLIFSTIVVTGYLFLKSGHLPDFLSLLRYQAQFYGLGFFMLPMPLVHSWIIYAAITAFAAGVYFNKPCPERGVMLSLSVLSAGIFSYYQGRSHSVVFSVIIFPAALLLGLGIDRILSGKTLPRSVAVWLWAMTIATSALWIIFTALSPNSAFMQSRPRHLFVTHPEKESPLAKSVTFLKAHTAPGKTVWILSNNASVYHVLSRTISPLQSSLIETFKRTEIDVLVQNLLQQNDVFADKSVLNTNTLETNVLLNQILEQQLTKNFTKVESDPDDHLSLWRKRNQ